MAQLHEQQRHQTASEPGQGVHHAGVGRGSHPQRQRLRREKGIRVREGGESVLGQEVHGLKTEALKS